MPKCKSVKSGGLSDLLVNNRTVLHFIVGLTIGFGLTCQFRSVNYAWRTASAKCSNDNIRLLSTAQTTKYSRTIDDLEAIWQKGVLMKSSGLLFAGIMTAQKYLDTRAVAIDRTWAREIDGRYAFFSSSSSR